MLATENGIRPRDNHSGYNIGMVRLISNLIQSFWSFDIRNLELERQPFIWMFLMSVRAVRGNFWQKAIQYVHSELSRTNFIAQRPSLLSRILFNGARWVVKQHEMGRSDFNFLSSMTPSWGKNCNKRENL